MAQRHSLHTKNLKRSTANLIGHAHSRRESLDVYHPMFRKKNRQAAAARLKTLRNSGQKQKAKTAPIWSL